MRSAGASQQIAARGRDGARFFQTGNSRLPLPLPKKAGPRTVGGVGIGTGPYADPLHRELPALRRIAAEAESTEQFPTDGVTILRRLGLLRMASPCPPGGGTKTNETLFEILRLLGTASLVLGRIYEGHVNALRLVACYATTDIAAQMACADGV